MIYSDIFKTSQWKTEYSIQHGIVVGRGVTWMNFHQVMYWEHCVIFEAVTVMAIRISRLHVPQPRIQ